MAKTKGELISDIELRLSRNKPSDDMEIPQSQINFWIDNAANAVLTDHINKSISSGNDVPKRYIKPSRLNAISIEQPLPSDLHGARYYVDVSSLGILEFGDMGGIVRVTNSGGKVYTPATYQQIRSMDSLWFSRSNKDNVMWYKEDEKVFLDGITPELYNKIKVNIFYVATIETSNLSDTEDYPLQDSLIPIVLDIAEETGLGILQTQLEDLQNDGVQA